MHNDNCDCETFWYVIPSVGSDRVHAGDRAAGARKKIPKGYEGCVVRAKRAIGFAPWNAVPEWVVVRDDETFADQAVRWKAVLALPDDM